MLESTKKLIKMYRISAVNERLGQFFVNRFIRSSWPELFYATDDNTAIRLIDEWLERHHYIDKLPMPIRPMVSTVDNTRL